MKKMGEIIRFLHWQDGLVWTFDEKVYFNSTVAEIETCAYCVKYEECHTLPEKRDIFIKV